MPVPQWWVKAHADLRSISSAFYHGKTARKVTITLFVKMDNFYSIRAQDNVHYEENMNKSFYIFNACWACWIWFFWQSMISSVIVQPSRGITVEHYLKLTFNKKHIKALGSSNFQIFALELQLYDLEVLLSSKECYLVAL